MAQQSQFPPIPQPLNSFPWSSVSANTRPSGHTRPQCFGRIPDCRSIPGDTAVRKVVVDTASIRTSPGSSVRTCRRFRWGHILSVLADHWKGCRLAKYREKG